MKVISFVFPAFAALFFSPCVRASDAGLDASAPVSAALSPVAETDHALILEVWGRVIARETDAVWFGLAEDERNALVKGLMGGAQRRPPPHDLDRIYTDVGAFVEARRALVRMRIRAENLAAAPAYFEALRKRDGVFTRPSGLCYEILRPGDDSRAGPDQTAVVTYHARLADGAEFDSTDRMGPVDVALPRIVPGWREGLQLIGVGGGIRLHVPPALAFTDEDAMKMGIPPASIVVCDIELLAIKDTPPEEPVPPSAPVPPPPPPSGFDSLAILETWGWILAQERGVMQAGLDEAERALLSRGLAAALAGEPAGFDETRLQAALADFVGRRRQAFEEATKQARLAENAAFFRKLAEDPGVVRLPSGLCYKIVRPGSGGFPRADQRVRVNYVGRLLDGSVFDRSDPEIGPLDIDLARVIPGWTEGMQKIMPGGIIQLYVPPGLAYGEVATGGIPANSALCFEVELLEVRDVPADE